MSEILEYIRLGIQAYDFFYDNHNIKIRPLTSMEFDKCEEASFKHTDDEIARFVMLVRLKDIKLNDEIRNFSKDMFARLQDYYNDINYYVVYYGMKDFMPDDFSVKDVRLMKDVHIIAQKIFEMSSADDNTVIDAIYNDRGTTLATVVYKFNQPLTSEAWKLTPLQHKFLKLAHPDSPKKVADTWEEFLEKYRGIQIVHK